MPLIFINNIQMRKGLSLGVALGIAATLFAGAVSKRIDAIKNQVEGVCEGISLDEDNGIVNIFYNPGENIKLVVLSENGERIGALENTNNLNNCSNIEIDVNEMGVKSGYILSVIDMNGVEVDKSIIKFSMK